MSGPGLPASLLLLATLPTRVFSAMDCLNWHSMTRYWFSQPSGHLCKVWSRQRLVYHLQHPRQHHHCPPCAVMQKGWDIVLFLFPRAAFPSSPSILLSHVPACFSLLCNPCSHGIFLQRSTGLPWWLSWLKNRLQCERPRFHSWVGKISWRRK